MPQDAVELVYRAALDEYGGARRLQLVAEWLAPRRRGRVGTEAGRAVRSGVLNSRARPHPDRPHAMETNPIRRSLDDLAQRCVALRGYL